MKWRPGDSQNERVHTVSFRIQREMEEMEPVVHMDSPSILDNKVQEKFQENFASPQEITRDDLLPQTLHLSNSQNLFTVNNIEPNDTVRPNNESQMDASPSSRHFPTETSNPSSRPEVIHETGDGGSKHTSHLYIKDTWTPSYSSTIDLISPNIQEPVKETSHASIMGGLLALSVGLGNIWRLPMILFAPYPGETLIAYIILMAVVGAPLVILEMGLGQFTTAGVVRLWRVVPLLKGVGIAQLLAGAYTSFYYGPLMSWAFQWGVQGIDNWPICDNLATPNITTCLCRVSLRDCMRYFNASLGESCFEHVVFQDDDHFNLKLLPMLAVSWIIVFLWLCWGHQVMFKLLCLSGLAAAILISASLALALSYSSTGAAQGLALLKPTQLWAFGRGEVWYGAIVQVIFSLPIGFGVLPALSQHFNFKNNFKRDGIIVWLCNIGFAMVSICAVFAWLGVIEKEEGSKLELRDPVTLIYVIHYYASLIGLQQTSLWAGLMCFLIFLAGVNTLVPQTYAIITAVIDEFPKLEQYYGILTSWTCLVMAAIGVSAIHPNGLLGSTMWDHYAAGGTVLSCLIVHVIGILWIYQFPKLQADFEFMGLEFDNMWRVFWAFVIPILLTIGELWGFLGLPLDGNVDCKFPMWVIGLGWFFYLLAVVVLELVVVKVILSQMEFGLKGKLMAAIKPLRSWGPRDPARHHHYKNNLLGYVNPEPNPVAKRSSPVLRANTSSELRLEAIKEPTVYQNSPLRPRGPESGTLRPTSVKVVRVPSTREYLERSAPGPYRN